MTSDSPGSASLRADSPAVVYRAQEQHKPWGHEQIFAAVEGRYVGKVIHVTAGNSISLQYHEHKEETICLISGDADIQYGPIDGNLTTRRFGPGDAIHLPPRVVHRVTAITDIVFAEASTAPPGWREDVVRLEDSYGRTGTSAP
ncbi:MAG TPA: cupin domain-containing protein [Streptosporangiaceae bacterium]